MSKKTNKTYFSLKKKKKKKKKKKTWIMAIFSFLVSLPVVTVNIEAFLSRVNDLCFEQSQKKRHSVKYYNTLGKSYRSV